MATGPDDTLPPWERFSPSAPTADTDQPDPVVDDENDDSDALDMEDEADDESVAQSGSGGAMSAVKVTAPNAGNDLPPWERFKAPAPVQAPKIDSPALASPGAPSDIMGRFQRLDSLDAPAPAAPTRMQMPRAPRGTFHPSVESAIEQASQNHGVDPDLLRTFARIESGGDPRQRTGSYKGIMQLSDREFARHGGAGDIYDPVANVNAGAIKLKAESADFERKYGRAPTASELYLIHQQGEGGAANHWANPDAPAWENMYRTAEGRQKGPAWAKQAVWGNVPDDVKRQYGSVDNITSGDFISLWDAKVNRFGGGQPTRVAAAPSPTKSDAPDLGSLMALAPEERIGALRQYMKTEFGVDVPAPPTQVAQAPVNNDLPPWERFKTPGAKTDKAPVNNDLPPWERFKTPGAKTDKAAAPSDDRWEITKGFVGGMLYGHPENFGNAVEGFGHILGSDAMVKKGGEWADWGKKNLESGYKARVPSFTDIRTSSVGDFLSDLGSYAGYGVGQGVSSSAPSLVMGTVGGLATANPYIGIAVGAFGPSYIQNFGDVYGSAKDDDGIKKRLAKGELTQKDLAATSTLAAVPMAALDVLGLEAVLGGSVFSQAKKDLSRRLVTGMVTGAVAEAPTEGMQEIISQWAQHWLGSETTFKEKFIKVVDNFLIGGLTGGAMGAAGSVRGGAAPPAAPSPEPPKTAVAVPEAPPIPGQAGTFAAGPDGQPSPAPATPPSAPPAPDESAILRQMGYSPEHIADMSPDERAAELANAAELGVKPAGKAADAPTAEPIGDLVAQAKDLADPNNERKGLYLSPDNVATVQSNPAWLDQLGAALTNKGGMVQNVDGNGGVLLTKDQATADAVRKALEAGVDSQTVLGAVTGAGTGKPADASAVVQQRTPDEAVTRESAVAQGDIAATERNLKAPGRTVKTVTPQEAIARREEGIAQAGTTPPPLPKGDGTRSSPVRIASAEDVSAAASAAASDYTPAQGEANNRKLGHAKWNGLDISLETDAGGIRRGLDPKTGQPWESRMAAPYGYFKGTKGADGMHVDVFMGPNPENGKVFVIDEKDRATGKFRQHKTFVGFDSEQDAVDAYVNSSNKSPEMIGGVTEMDPGGFKDWLTKGKRTRPVSDMRRNAGETVASPAETVATDAESVATPSGNSFTDQDIESLIRAWRYVNAIEQAMGAGRDIQQKRLDIANELDADLASYGIAFGDFPDERSLRQYLGERRRSDQGGNAQVEEAQPTQEEAASEAAARTPARPGRAQGEEAPVGEPRQDDGGPAGTRQVGRGTEVGKSRRYDGEPLSADEIDAVVDAWRYVSEEDAKPKPQSLTQFVIAAGGVNDQSREVRHIAGAAKERPGLVNSRGMDLDDAARIAWESGFLGDSTDRPTVADFLEKLQDDLHTGTVVRTADEPRLEDIRIAAEMAEELSSYGITPRRFRSEQAVRDYFGQGRESNPATSAPREESQSTAVERESPARPAEADEVTKAPETGPSGSRVSPERRQEMEVTARRDIREAEDADLVEKAKAATTYLPREAENDTELDTVAEQDRAIAAVERRIADLSDEIRTKQDSRSAAVRRDVAELRGERTDLEGTLSGLQRARPRMVEAEGRQGDLLNWPEKPASGRSEPSPDFGEVHKWWRNELTPAGRRLAVQDAGLKKKDLHKVAWQYLSKDEQAAIAKAYAEKYQNTGAQGETIHIVYSGGDRHGRNSDVLETFRDIESAREFAESHNRELGGSLNYQNKAFVQSGTREEFAKSDSFGHAFRAGKPASGRSEPEASPPASGENAAPAQTSGQDEAFQRATAEAKSYVLTKGKADGKEHGMTVRPDGSTVVASTEGNRTNFIAINETQTPELYQDTERVLEFHHNHPSSTSFSRSDIVMGTMLKSLKRLHAHGHNGNSYAVDFLTSDASEIDKAFNTANDKLQAIVRQAIADGKITRDVGNAYYWHMVNTMLAEAGFTKYEADFASKRKAKADVAAYRKIIGSAWSRILTEIGVPKNVSDQRSDSIRDTARVEVAPAETENARPERAASEEGNERGRSDNQADGSQGREVSQSTSEWLAARDKRIKESKASGRKHLDDLPRYVEGMRGVPFYNVHDPMETGVVRTVANTGEVVVNWSNKYSADKNLVSEKTTDGKESVWQSWLLPTDLKDYVVAGKGVEKAWALRDRLLDPDGGFKTIVEARKFAKSIGIEGSAKQVDEAIEAAVVAAAREIVRRNVRRDRNGNVVTTTADVKRAYSSLVSLYDRQPNIASRTGTSVANQAYSTPMPLAYLASRLAGVAPAKTIYEPTAGNGALLIEANPADQTVHANELDPNRAAVLKAQGFDATSKDGSVAPGVKNIDSVIMNPPFGAVKEGGKSKTFYVQSSTAKTRADAATWSTNQIDHAVALNGLEAMADDGRAVLILGGTKSTDIAARRKDYRGKAKREFYYRLYGQYNVTDHFTVSGDLYSKQGASWPVDVIVIEGRGKSARALPAAEPPAILTSWDQLAEKLPDATGRNELAPRKADEQTGSAPEAGGEPATGDGKPEPTTDRGGSEPLQSKAEGKPRPVRAERDRGQPADVGSGERDAASETRSDRDGGRTDNTADSEPVRPRVKREKKAPSGGQARYEPVSNVASLDTLIPVNMAGPARNAMERVSERHGDLDEFVSERLGYDKKDLGRYFSAEQIDALASAIDNVERGSAQIVGDQTGIGKGRIAAGMLRYAMKRGMVPVFVTEKPDLYGDMFRDLRDIGVPEMLGRDVRMFMTNAGETITLDEEALFWKQEVEEAKRNGEKPPKRRGMFLVGGTVAKVNEGMRAIAADENEKGKIGDVVFTTYDQLNTVKGATTPRRQFLSSIAPRAMIILDEAHNAGGGGKKDWEKKDAVANRADFARDLAARAKGVMFSSATYAKRPDVMDLYARTDMGKAVDDPKDLPDLIQRGGVPMQQIVASMLAESGQYIRRERSFDGVEYALEPVPVDLKVYKQFSASMQAIFKFDLAVEEFRKEWGNDALDQRGWAKKRDEGVGSGSANSTSFGALMHNITNQMLLAIKAEQTAKRAIAAHKAGEKPVIALANTNESFIKDFAEQEGIKIGSTLDLDFSAVLDRYLTRTLRVTVTGPEENAKAEHLQILLKDLPASLQQEFRNAQNLVQAGDYSSLPISPIDWIRYRLGEAGMSVKEVTGRQTMIDYASPAPKYVARPKSEMGASGKRGSIAYFNAGRLDALILNRSGSTGVSMHASATFKDKRKRRMILAQAEGNIDTHCLDEKTEVLTPSGFKGIADKFDAVAAFDPATGAISWEPVTGRVERPLGADEVMYGILSPALDIRVTNKHRMLMKHRRQSIGWRLETAEFLGARRGGWRMPVSGLQPPTQSCPLTDHELGFIGWVLTDGTINYQSRQIVIWQAEHQPHHEHIKACLEGCGFKYGVTENRGETQYNRTSRSIGYTISLGQWRHLKEYLNKDFPVAFEALDRRQLSVLLHALHLGDGTKFLGQPWTARSYHIATGRKTFAERLQSLCVRRGYRCNVSVQSYNLNPLYMIRIKDKIEQHVGGVNHGDGRPYFGPVDFDKSETVWCVENRLGTLITRRNGKVAFVGNCQMLGRVHRTGQVLTPAYTQIAAEIPAEARPTAVLMKKMASLNANTTGARSSAFTVDSVDFINEVGDKVVSDILIEDPDLNDMLGEPLKFDEKGVPKKEDVARKATGRLVLLDPDVQTRFLDQVQKAYQAEIEQLDALGENPLEAKTVDLQAKQLDATEVKPKQGDSPFLDAVRIEKVSAKAQGRAMPPSEVAGKVAEFLKVERPAADDAASLAALEAKGRTWKDSEVSRVTGLMRDQIREEVAATSADSRDSVRARLDAQLSRWQQTMNIAYPGSRITLGMPAGDLDGVVMSVERTGKAKQMTALGSWTVKIAVPDSMRVLEFPMSKLFPPNVVKSEDEKGATLVRSGTSHGALVAKFEDARKEGRETRYIVTGNILGGFDQTNGKGRIVNYTTEDGTLRPGILMGREFALDKFMGARRVRFQSGEQVARFLTEVPSAEVSSSVGEIVVSAYRGEYRIETAAAKQKAGQFFADRDILKTIAPSDFQRRGSKMIAFGLPRGVMAKVVDQMMANGAKFETNQSQEDAQKVIARGLREDVKRSVMEDGQPMFSLVGRRVSQEASSLAPQLSEAVNLIARITGRDAVDVRFHDRISTAGVSTDQMRATQAAGFDARAAGGYYRQRRSIDAVPLIGLATGDPSFDLMTTAGHEAFHHVEEVLATPQERNLMESPSEMQRIRRLAGDELGLAATDPQLAALPGNEVRAIAFQRYRRMREEGLANASRIHIAARKFFDKLIRVFEGVRNLLRGRGYNSFESIFERARTGEMANAYADRRVDAAQRVGSGEANDAAQAVGGVLPEDAMAALIPAAIANRATNVMRRISLQPRTDAVRTYLQDKLLPLRRLQESIQRQTGVALPVGVDAYKMESLYHGRSGERQADLSATFEDPLVKILRDAKITTEQFDDYLYARHAEERNREIAPLHPAGSDFAEAVRDPDRVGGSGMSAREARDILSRVAADPRAAEFARAAGLIDRMIDETLDLEYQSGLITKEQYDENRRGVRWQHYVPLRGTEKEDISIPGRGRGFDVRGPEWKQALGRRTKADSPLSYAIQAAHMAVVRAEKNRVDKTLLRLVESYPDPAIWQVYKGEARRRVNPDTGLVETYWVPPGFVRKDNIFGAKVGGKQHYVEIKHEGLANALRTAPPGFWGTAPGRLFYKTARLYAQLVTSYNPEFMLSNSIRDLETALVNIGDFANKPADLRRRIAKEALTLKSIRGVMAALQAHEGFTVMGGRRAADETMIGTKRSAEATAYAKWYDEYRLAGGKISFMDMFDVDEIKSQIDKDVAAGNAKRIVQSTFKLIDNANTAVENGVRLSTYIALRQHGISQAEAASVARELTVNFNRKGSAGPGINALYLFFNASIQGTTRMMQAISRSRAVQAAVVGIIGSGIVLDMLNYMVAGDDDDGENKYDKIKDWIKEKNIIIMLPGRKDYIMIPMAYGYNVPYLAGQNAMAAIRGAAGYGGIKPTTALANVLGAAIESFSPFGASKSWAQFVSPTLLDPFTQVWENKTFFGGKIQPEKRDKNKPDSENFYSTTPWWWVDMARTMNRWSGGNQASAGWADISPNTLAHYADFVAGGVGKFAMNLVATGERTVTGKDWLPEKTPFVRRVYGGKGSIESRLGEFYEAWTAIDAAHSNAFQNAKAGRREDAQKARDESPAELQVWSAFKGTSQGLTVLRKKRDAINLDRTMSSEDKQKQLDEITRQENDRIVRVMKLYNQAKRDARKKGTSP